MHWPQVAIIIIYTLSLGLNMAEHGKPRTGKYNFWGSLFATTVIIIILKLGGFFG